MDKRPWGITVACLVFGITALLALYAGFTMPTDGATGAGLMVDEEPVLHYFLLNVEAFNFAGSQLILVAVGLIFLLTAWFLWKKQQEAWFFAVGLLGINIIIALAMMLLAGASVGLIAFLISLVALFALFHKDTISAVKPEMINYPGWDLGKI